MIEHWHSDHARVFDRATHQFIVLNASTVISDGDNACLRQRTDRRQFFPGKILGDRASWQDTHLGHFRRSIFNPCNRAWTVRGRRCIRHANHCREPTRRGGAGTGFNRLFPAKAGLSEMNVNIDEPGTND